MTVDSADIDVVGVVGAGTMGSGIAQVAAMAGHTVWMRDINEDLVADGLDRIRTNLTRAVESGAIDATERSATLDRIHGTTEMADFAEVDIAIEAVLEDLDLKQDVFTTLDEVTPEKAILATNTSSLSITSIASATDRPTQVIGIHFMNPVPVMEGVEIVIGEETAPAVAETAHAFVEQLEKKTWEADDKPGFVTNRILMPWIAEGIRAYDEGVATKEDIDTGMRLGTNVPMGPLELADHIGLDICLHTMETLAEELGDRYRPPYLLQRKVAADHLGKKTGQGFYTYDD